MKRQVLSFQTRKMIKGRSDTSSLGYQKARCVGVIVNNDHKWEGLSSFLLELERDHDELHTIYFNKSVENALTGKPSFFPTDFGFFGQINSDMITKFTSPAFDYVFILDKEPSLFIDCVAVKANSKTNIGFYYENGNDIADLQIKPDHGRELDDMLRYAKQLS